MQSNWAKVGIPAAAIAVVVVLFVVLSGGSGNGDGAQEPVATTEQTDRDLSESATGGGEGEDGQGAEVAGQKEPTIVIRDGGPVDGVAELDYKKGDQARFRIRSDVTDEVHVHGYDIIKDVEAGGSVTFDFPADIDGLFEVELEGSHAQIARLRVRP